MNPRLSQCVIAASIGVLSLQNSFADVQTGNLSSIVGVYQGQIESITMVKAETEFFLDSSNNVVGRYRYQDQGSWDNGTLFDIRLGRGASCGVGRAVVGAWCVLCCSSCVAVVVLVVVVDVAVVVAGGGGQGVALFCSRSILLASN